MTVFALLFATLLGSSPAPGPIAIDTTDAGKWVGVDVRVVAWDQREVRVEREPVKGDPSQVGATIAPGGRGTLITAQYSGPRTTQFFGLLHKGSGVTVRLIVHVPAHAALRVRSANGDVSIEGTASSLDLNTSNGDIVASGTGPNVLAHTSNGDVHVQVATLAGAPPNIDMQSSNGDVVLSVPEGFNSRVTTRTSNGDVHNPFAHAPATGKVSLTTNNGDVKISVGR